MANELETNTKNFIRSLLMSSPLSCTIQELMKDYHNTIGEEIPYHRMGYKSVEEFLKSIPDVARVTGVGPFAQVRPVVTEKSAHINEMVAKQKTKSKKKNKHGCNNTTRRFFEYPRFNQNYNRPVYSPKFESLPQPHESPVNNVVPERPIFQQSYNKPVCSPKLESLPQRHESPVSDVVSSDNLKASDSQAIIMPNSIKLIKTNKMIKSSLNSAMSNLNLKKVQNPPKLKMEHTVDCSKVPLYVQKNLKRVISRNPQGIWCADLPDKYKRFTGKVLPYETLGYRRLIDMCIDLSHIFHYVQPDVGDFILYDKDKPLPSTAEKPLTVSSYEEPPAESTDTFTSLGWEYYVSIIPDDIFRMGEIIPRAFIPQSTNVNDELDVVVVEIYDPSKFWIYLQGTVLDDLMNNMQTFYRENCEKYLVPEFLLEEGLYCTQIIYGEYHRAIVVDSLPDVKDQVKLLYIDYGTLTRAPVKGICFLTEKFAKLPWQQIRCRLANIAPVQEQSPWPMETIKRFSELIRRRDIYAKISHINYEEQIVEVYLADKTDEKIFYINDKLVEEGLAQYSTKERMSITLDTFCKPIVKNIHRYPTFDELEFGLTPTLMEMSGYNDCGVPFNFCIPQYYEYSKGEEENIKSILEFHGKNVSNISNSEIPHNYETDAIRMRDFDFDIFGTYGDQMNDVFNECLYFYEDVPESTGNVAASNDTVKADPCNFVNIEENVMLTQKMLSDLNQSVPYSVTSDPPKGNYENEKLTKRKNGCNIDSSDIESLSDDSENSATPNKAGHILSEIWFSYKSDNDRNTKQLHSTNPFLNCDSSTPSDFSLDISSHKSNNPFLNDYQTSSSSSDCTYSELKLLPSILNTEKESCCKDPHIDKTPTLFDYSELKSSSSSSVSDIEEIDTNNESDTCMLTNHAGNNLSHDIMREQFKSNTGVVMTSVQQYVLSSNNVETKPKMQPTIPPGFSQMKPQRMGYARYPPNGYISQRFPFQAANPFSFIPPQMYPPPMYPPPMYSAPIYAPQMYASQPWGVPNAPQLNVLPTLSLSESTDFYTYYNNKLRGPNISK